MQTTSNQKKQGGNVRADAVVSLPIDADGNILKWNKSLPKRAGWYWIRGKFNGLNRDDVVWFDPKKDRIRAFGHVFLTKDIPEWGGPLCPPID